MLIESDCRGAAIGGIELDTEVSIPAMASAMDKLTESVRLITNVVSFKSGETTATGVDEMDIDIIIE